MDLPLGFIRQGEFSNHSRKLVCRLHMSIYGLKQVFWQRYSKFSSYIIQLGFKQSKSDYSLFTKGSGSSFLALLVYINDIIITGPHSQEIEYVNSLSLRIWEV